MTDILLLILTPLGGYLISVLVAKRPQRRESLWFGLYTFCLELRNNVLYGKASLSDFASEYCKRHTELSSCQAIEYYLLNQDKNMQSINLSVNSEESAQLDRFFEGLYQPNAQALLQHTEYYTQLFKDYADNQRLGNAKTVPLYHKLGVLCGIAVALLLM